MIPWRQAESAPANRCRFIVIREQAQRHAVHALFVEANAAAGERYRDEQQALYADLKLEGLREAPQHVCVVCDHEADCGHGLGRQTMPETATYSAVCAVQNLWLAARAEGVAVGWVSILNPDAIKRLLHVPARATVVAYLCLGFVDEFADRPDLERRGWEQRIPLARVMRRERFDQSY